MVKGKKKVQKYVTKQAQFILRAIDTNTQIGEDKNTDCLGTTAYLIAATTTTIDNTVTKPEEKVGNNISNFTCLGTTEPGIGDWPILTLEQRGKKKNNPKMTAWIKKTALGSATTVNRKNIPILSRTVTTMTNSVSSLAPIMGKLITLITNSNLTIDGTCVMAVALHQQNIYTLNDLQSFDFTNQFEICFSAYKVNDADAGTNTGTDVVIVQGIKMYI